MKSDIFEQMVNQIAKEIEKKENAEDEPKIKHVDRHKPGYMRDYMRNRRYRGMFQTPYTE